MKPTDTVTLDLGPHGQLKGSLFANGVKRFFHIPYAKPPTGPRRWRRPEPHPKDYVYGSNGFLDCTRYGNVCPQPEYIVKGNSMINTDYKFEEDCLAVNLWLPPGDAPKEGWPILAWIHGGWLQIGDPSLKEHTQPTQLIAEGGLKAIVISIGYRLNIFGFLAGEGLKGNFGFWLNYELFRGDDQRPLFNNVWLQSNAVPAQPKTLKEASSAEKLDRLRQIPASSLVKKIFDLDIHTFRGVTDDEMIPSDLVSSIHSGAFAARFKERGMRILLGEAETEEVLYALTNPPPSSSESDMLRGLNNYYALPVCKDLLSLYNTEGTSADTRVATALNQKDDAEKAKQLFGLVTSDVQVRAPIRVLSKALFDGGVPPEHILRYRVAYRPDCTDKVYPKSFGVTHSADGVSWWFVERYGFSGDETKRVEKWLSRTLVPLVVGGQREVNLELEEFLCFKESGQIEVVKDAHWKWMMRVAEKLG
ncbi:hypothetical protein SLS59_002810 [Nothophoma quercina]|uniref:Carboxylesterase type B domain-containing protein n=1 Tax=Nothophoma quercina TaxID=749835 RepID=A0ABR3RRP9_9PLEO